MQRWRGSIFHNKRLTYDTDVESCNDIRLSGELWGEGVAAEQVMGGVWGPRLVRHHCLRWGMSCEVEQRSQTIKLLHQIEIENTHIHTYRSHLNRSHNCINPPIHAMRGMLNYTCMCAIFIEPVCNMSTACSTLWSHAPPDSNQEQMSQVSTGDCLTSLSRREGTATAHLAALLTDELISLRTYSHAWVWLICAGSSKQRISFFHISWTERLQAVRKNLLWDMREVVGPFMGRTCVATVS